MPLSNVHGKQELAPPERKDLRASGMFAKPFARRWAGGRTKPPRVAMSSGRASPSGIGSKKRWASSSCGLLGDGQKATPKQRL